jgi:hypothetical protein
VSLIDTHLRFTRLLTGAATKNRFLRARLVEARVDKTTLRNETRT